MSHRQQGGWGFQVVNYTILAVLALVTVIPFIYVIAGSFATPAELREKGFLLFPTEFSLDAYRYVFSSSTIPGSLLVTIYITVVGTLINLVMTSLMAYPLSRKELDGRRFFLMMVIFTMLFNGGMIPTYLVVKSTGLLNTFWALMIPNAISSFYVIIMKNFFQNLPGELIESAKIDGNNDLGILIRIVLPLSKPALATFTLFYAVMHWNTFFMAIMYINDYDKWPVQVWLRQVVILSQGGFGDEDNIMDDYVVPQPQTIKMAVIVVSTMPILLVYPFLQKYFAKGILLGSIKG